MSAPIYHKPIDSAQTNVGVQNNNDDVLPTKNSFITDTFQARQTNNIGSSMNPINRIIMEGDQSLVRSEMNKALDLLNAIEKACDEGTKAQFRLDRKTQHVGTVRNLFYKFLGIFSKSLETQKRTQALNAKLHSVATRLKTDKNLYNGVLLSTLNDTKLDASLKTTCFKLYDNDPEIQDKLFKSLKEPTKEIREKFWERHGEKILNGDFFGFKLKNTDAESVKSEFMFVKQEPLKSLFVKNISAAGCRNLNEYREIFENSNLPNIFTKGEHIETFLMSYFSVTEEHAKTLLQDDIEAGKVGGLKKQHRQNAEEIVNYLLKDPPVDCRRSILPFRELFQGSGKRFSFTADGQTVCDIDRDKLRSRAEQRALIEKRKLNERLQTAQSNLNKAEVKRKAALHDTEEKDAAFADEMKADKVLTKAKKDVENYRPTVMLEDFLDEIKTQIKGKNIEKASIEKLALFLASGISLMPPNDQFGRGICHMDRCCCSCTVSKDGTLIINQKFDKTKSDQGGELALRFRKATVEFRSLSKKCYTETSMEIERTYDLFASGSRNPKTAELKSFEHTVKFKD